MSDFATPHDIEAERAVLGACLLDRDAFAAAASILAVSDFFRHGHAVVFRAFHRLASQDMAPDLVKLRAVLSPAEVEEAGGAAYLAGLIDGVPRATQVADYARIVRARALDRQVILVARKAIAQISEGQLSAQDVAQLTAAALDGVGKSGRANVIPELESLRAQLARPIEPVRFRIEGLQPIGGRALLVAQFKSGKTTLVNALVKSLADQEAFLGRFNVAPLNGPIVVVDAEMSRRQGLEWLRESGIRRDDRVIYTSMRGRLGEFNILDAATRSAWASEFRAAGVSYLVLDCVRPLLDTLGLDEHREAGRLLVAFDALLDEAGIGEALVVQHMGHAGERARGDSRFRDWPDVEWSLVRKDDDPRSERYFRAFGRDVDVVESQLQFDAVTRGLSIVGGSRQDAKTDAALTAVVDVVRSSSSGLSGRAVKRALDDSGHSRAAVEAALVRGVESGALVKTTGPRNSDVYRLSESVSRSVPPVSRNSVSECPAAFIRRDAGTHNDDDFSVQRAQEDTDAIRI